MFHLGKHFSINTISVNQKYSWATTWQNNKMSVHPAKTQISLGIRPVWSES